MGKRKNFIGVEDVLNIFDTNRVWYYIPGFNGYELSSDGYLQSMKHYRRYPYGILIQPVKRKPYNTSTDPLYELSDNDNIRQRIRLSQLTQLAATNQFNVAGYPRATIITDGSSRNHFVRNEEGAYVKVYNGPKSGGGRNGHTMPLLDNKTRYAKFTIIQDGTEMPFMEYQQSKVRVPIKPIEGETYYGRKDCRTLCDINV